MHHRDARSRGWPRTVTSRERRALVFIPSVLSACVEPNREDFHRRMLETRLRDPEFRAEYEHVYAEMLEQLAPATEGPSGESRPQAARSARPRRRHRRVSLTRPRTRRSQSRQHRNDASASRSSLACERGCRQNA
jgi:hypothetical protein